MPLTPATHVVSGGGGGGLKIEELCTVDKEVLENEWKTPLPPGHCRGSIHLNHSKLQEAPENVPYPGCLLGPVHETQDEHAGQDSWPFREAREGGPSYLRARALTVSSLGLFPSWEAPSYWLLLQPVK